MPQPQLLKSRKKPARIARAALTALAAFSVIAAISAGPERARAIVVPRAVSGATPLPEPSRNANDLPASSSLFFVLDDVISSRGQAGTEARAHLRDPIVVGGITVAPTGTTVRIRITHTEGAQMANVDGSVDIYFEPLTLASGATLPLVTPSSHIDPHLTSGQASTRAVTDTVGDIFIPYHYLYHMLRKGMEVTLRPGTVMRARTAATLQARGGVVAVVSPPPVATGSETPRSPFKIAPVATPPGFEPPTPKPSPSALPSAQPSPSP